MSLRSSSTRIPRFPAAVAVFLFLIVRGTACGAIEFSPGLQAVSPAGNAVARVPEDNPTEIHVIGLPESETRVLSAGDDSRFRSIVYSPDAQRLAAGTGDGRILIWDMPAGELALTLKHPEHSGRVSRIEIAPGGERLAAFYDDASQVVVWDTAKSEPLASMPASAGDIQHLWFTQDGKVLATASALGLWCYRDGLEPRQLLEERNQLRTLFRSPDGTLAATKSLWGFQIWNLLEDTDAEKLDYEKPIQVLFTRDGKRLLVLRPDENNDRYYALDLWDLSGGVQQATFFYTIEKLVVPHVVLSSDHSQMVSVHDCDRDDLELRVTNLQDAKQELAFGLDYSFSERSLSGIADMAFAPDGKSLATLWSDGLVALWDLRTTRCVTQFVKDRAVQSSNEPYPLIVAMAKTASPVDRLQFAAGGAVLLAQGPSRHLTVWEAKADLLAVKPQVFAFRGSSSGFKDIEGFDLAADGRRLAAIADYSGAVLIDSQTGQSTFLARDPFLVRFNREGTKLHLTGEYATSQFDLASGRLFTLPRRPPATERSYQERLAGGVSFESGTSGLIDPDSGAAVASFKPENIESSGQRAISRDNTKFATLGRSRNSDGQGIEVFDVKTAERLTYMPISLDSWTRLRFNPDGSLLLVATNSNILVVDYRRRKTVDTLWPHVAAAPKSSARSKSWGAGDAATESTADDVVSTSWAGGSIRSMDVTSAGQIAVGAEGGDLTLMTLDSGNPYFALKLPGGTIQDVAYSDDGKRLVCQMESQLFLMDVPSRLDDVPDPGAVTSSREADSPTEMPEDNFAARQAAKVKVAQTLSALMEDGDPHVRQLAQELLRRLEDAAAAPAAAAESQQ